MNRGGKALILLAATALAGCTADRNHVQVRAIADPAAKFRQGSEDIAAARGQLALGNVGLALEAFRIIQRNRPTDPAAPAGIAECYAEMGRFDLAQSNYEAALALSPHDPKLLLGLAGIFERQGDTAGALAVRAEAAAAQTAAAPAIIAVPRQAQASPVAISAPQFVSAKLPHVGSITVELPKARPVDHFASDPNQAHAQLAQAAATMPIAAPAAAPAPTAPVQPQQVAVSLPVRSTITVALPPPRPADRIAASGEARLQLAQAAATIPLGPIAAETVSPAKPLVQAAIVQPAKPTPELPSSPMMKVALAHAHSTVDNSGARSELAQAATVMPLELAAPSPPKEPRPAPLKSADMPATFAEAAGPRIERISPGEVMLVTTGRSLWRPQTAPTVLASNSVRWIPLGNASVRPNVQVLNAARREGLARSARSVLVDRGWRRIQVADAPQVREKSVVLYPKNRPALGRSLAAQFGVTAEASDVAFPTLLLGRDAPGLVRSQRKS